MQFNCCKIVKTVWINSELRFFLDSSEDHASPSDLECGSESDTYFASISKSEMKNEMPFNLSFSTISSNQITHSSPKKTCDQESSSGISSSPNTATDNSPSCSYAFVPKSPLGISGHSSHIWSLNSSSKKNIVSSDSDMSSPRCSEKLGATSYMTLRRTTKRKSRQSLCYSASFAEQHWENCLKLCSLNEMMNACLFFLNTCRIYFLFMKCEIHFLYSSLWMKLSQSWIN